jgi:hypothetical protein
VLVRLLDRRLSTPAAPSRADLSSASWATILSSVLFRSLLQRFQLLNRNLNFEKRPHEVHTNNIEKTTYMTNRKEQKTKTQKKSTWKAARSKFSLADDTKKLPE